MAKIVEVDEEQLIADRKLRGYVSALMGNPKAKLKVQEAMKIVDPNAQTPELDQQSTINEPVKALADRFEAFVNETKTEKAEREKAEKLGAIDTRMKAGLQQLRRDGWTEEGVKAVEKIMEDQGILDPEIAAAYYEKKNPPPAPMTPGGTGAWNFMELPSDGSADLKKLIETRGESDLVINKLANDALNEVRGISRR